MAAFTVTLPSGELWIPQFVTAINADKCIGCGRCFKVCARNVLTLVALKEDGGANCASDDDEDDEEYDRKVMVISKGGSCIGCEACSSICPRNCISHAAAQV